MKPLYSLSHEHMPLDTLDSELKHINPVCLDILYRRGFATNDQIRSILFPSFEDAIKPLTCNDIEPAICCLASAIRSGFEIVVYRDYDVDGISAGAVAVEALTKLGATVHDYANAREVDGYGICSHGIDVVLQQWPNTKLILTVDNGIVANNAIAYAVERGLMVIVTDHHEPGPEIPAAAVAVVDLKRKDETYPYHDLCGCGLIFRIMLDLYRYMKMDPSPVFGSIDLVALATVADVVPLIGENRALVQEGLRVIESGNRPFFKAIMKLFNVAEVNAHYTLAFQFAPAINSLSRMGVDTSLAVEALLSKDEVQVYDMVESFLRINQMRKDKTKEQLDLAMSMVDTSQNNSAIVLFSEKFDEGIVGIIAGRLKEKFWRPVIILAKTHSGILRGSGRSIDEFDLKSALDACSTVLMGYGGHKKAAGLTLNESNFEAFKSMFSALANKALAGKELHPQISLAAVLTEDCLSEQLVRDLRILEPYGEGFPEPLFGLRAQPDVIKYMGKQNQHVKLTCSESQIAIIMWNAAKRIRAYEAEKNTFPCKYVGKPSLNIWNGNVSVQFIQAS